MYRKLEDMNGLGPEIDLGPRGQESSYSSTARSMCRKIIAASIEAWRVQLKAGDTTKRSKRQPTTLEGGKKGKTLTHGRGK